MEQERRIVRLAKPVKKGLLRLIFSRVPVIALLLALQVLILLTVYSWLATVLSRRNLSYVRQIAEHRG